MGTTILKNTPKIVKLTTFSDGYDDFTTVSEVSEESAIDILYNGVIHRIAFSSYEEMAANAENEEEFFARFMELEECEHLTNAIRYYFDGKPLEQRLTVHALPNYCIAGMEVFVSDDDFILATSHDTENMNLWRIAGYLHGARLTNGLITQRLREYGYAVADKVSRIKIGNVTFFDIDNTNS